MDFNELETAAEIKNSSNEQQLFSECLELLKNHGENENEIAEKALIDILELAFEGFEPAIEYVYKSVERDVNGVYIGYNSPLSIDSHYKIYFLLKGWQPSEYNSYKRHQEMLAQIITNSIRNDVFCIIPEFISDLILNEKDFDDNFFELGQYDDEFELDRYIKYSKKINDPDAKATQGLLHINGSDYHAIAKDTEKGIQLLKEAYLMGSATAAYFLGSFYYKFNTNEAIEWFVKAADKNHPIACYRLALIYDIGVQDLVQADPDKAQKFYQQAWNGGWYKAKRYIKD